MTDSKKLDWPSAPRVPLLIVDGVWCTSFDLVSPVAIPTASINVECAACSHKENIRIRSDEDFEQIIDDVVFAPGATVSDDHASTLKFRLIKLRRDEAFRRDNLAARNPIPISNPTDDELGPERFDVAALPPEDRKIWDAFMDLQRRYGLG